MVNPGHKKAQQRKFWEIQICQSKHQKIDRWADKQTADFIFRDTLLLDVNTWSSYILSSCCIVMMLYVHTWSTHLHSILLRNHTWELHWYPDDNDNNNNGQWHTLNLSWCPKRPVYWIEYVLQKKNLHEKKRFNKNWEHHLKEQNKFFSAVYGLFK